MRAIEITPDHGLVWREVPDPRPAPGEVVIQVEAAAVNPADLLQRRGVYPPPPGAPPYPGLECSGRIAAIGPEVTGWTVGDEVCALLGGGGYAERVAVPAGQLLPRPSGVSLRDVAGLPEVACTVWSGLFMAADLKAGETLLVHGGAGGIGTMAIQLARSYGVRVIATAGSAEKCRVCEDLGAEAINYNEEDFASRTADVVLDIMGAAYFERNIEVLNTGGRLVIIAARGGTKTELDIGTLMRKRAAVHAMTLRGRPGEEKAEIVAGVREGVWPRVEAGQVRPVIHTAVPMRDAMKAHRLLETGAHVGKVLLTT